MMRSYPDPSGNYPSDESIRTAQVMRNILNEDIPECDLALSVQSFNSAVPSQQMLNAWWLMRSDERALWKRMLEYVNPNYSLDGALVN